MFFNEYSMWPERKVQRGSYTPHMARVNISLIVDDLQKLLTPLFISLNSFIKT